MLKRFSYVFALLIIAFSFSTVAYTASAATTAGTTCGIKISTGKVPSASCGFTNHTKSSTGFYKVTTFGCSAGKTDSGDNCSPACSMVSSVTKTTGTIKPSHKTGSNGNKGHYEPDIQYFVANADEYGCNKKVKVTNPKTGKAVVALSIDRGPSCSVQRSGVKLDMSYAASSAIGNPDVVKVETVSDSTPIGPYGTCGTGQNPTTPKPATPKPATPKPATPVAKPTVSSAPTVTTNKPTSGQTILVDTAVNLDKAQVQMSAVPRASVSTDQLKIQIMYRKVGDSAWTSFGGTPNITPDGNMSTPNGRAVEPLTDTNGWSCSMGWGNISPPPNCNTVWTNNIKKGKPAFSKYPTYEPSVMLEPGQYEYVAKSYDVTNGKQSSFSKSTKFTVKNTALTTVKGLDDLKAALKSNSSVPKIAEFTKKYQTNIVISNQGTLTAKDVIQRLVPTDGPLVTPTPVPTAVPSVTPRPTATPVPQPTVKSVTIYTFGYSFAGPPSGMQLVADVRNIDVDKFNFKKTERGDGSSSPRSAATIRSDVMSVQAAKDWLKKMENNWTPQLKNGSKIAIGCSRGHHRSVTLAIQYGNYLKSKGYKVTYIHRDINKSW